MCWLYLDDVKYVWFTKSSFVFCGKGDQPDGSVTNRDHVNIDQLPQGLLKFVLQI